MLEFECEKKVNLLVYSSGLGLGSREHTHEYSHPDDVHSYIFTQDIRA